MGQFLFVLPQSKFALVSLQLNTNFKRYRPILGDMTKFMFMFLGVVTLCAGVFVLFAIDRYVCLAVNSLSRHAGCDFGVLPIMHVHF